MSIEAVPRNRLTDDDYRAIEAAVVETERGRWFLAEHADRNRSTDATSILDALTKLERTPPPTGVTPEGVDNVLTILTQLKPPGRPGVPDGELRPAHERPQQTAHSAAIAARKTVEKIREVAYELREAGRNDIFADALDLYCQDLVGAADLQEDAVSRLADLAAILVTIENRLRGGSNGAPPPGEPEARPQAPAIEDSVPASSPSTPSASVEYAPPTQPEAAENDDEPTTPELEPRAAVNGRTLAFFNPG